MGDIIEFVTSPSLGHRCFKLTSSAINFDIKSVYYATIILSKIEERGNHIWVSICNEGSWIHQQGLNRVLAKTPEILNGNLYRRFWLTWTGDLITLGKSGVDKPIIKFPCKSPKAMYVRFLTHKEGHSVHWRVELPPFVKRPFLNHITKGSVHWVCGQSQLPKDALIGGFEKEKLYIMRALHAGSLTPGKLVPSQGVGYIAWGYIAHEKTEFEVLCGYNCVWVPSKRDKIPVGAVEGGYSEVQREMLYVGRASYCGYIIPGKIQPSHRVCYIAFNGKTVAVENYEILTVPYKRRCNNKHILPIKKSYNMAYITENNDTDSDDYIEDYYDNDINLDEY